jgi:DNA adenine methylase
MNNINCSIKNNRGLDFCRNNPLKLKSLIPYFGGKTKVADKIISKFPKHKIYVELFIGGGSVYWKETEAEKFVINDLNQEVYNLYKTGKSKPNQLKKCKLNPGRAGFNKIKNKKKHTACDTMVLFKHSFGADGKSYANHHGLRNNNFSDKHAEKLKKTTVLNQDFRKVMKSYDKKGVIQYLDPPYVVQGKTYKIHGVNAWEVCEAMKDLKHAKAVLSYDIHSEVRKACKGLKFSKIKFKYQDPKKGGISNNLKSEYLIKNY